MHTAHLRKVGGSVMLAVPPALLDVLELKAGATVGIAVDAGRLIIEPQATPRYTMAELLAQCEVDRKPTQEDEEWLEAAPVGDELL